MVIKRYIYDIDNKCIGVITMVTQAEAMKLTKDELVKMVGRKGRKKPRPLTKRLAEEPIGTLKREYKKLPLPVKIGTGLAVSGAIIGPVAAEGLERVPIVGRMAQGLVNAGAMLRARLFP